MTLERIQKIVARAGVAARRKAEDQIREGRVKVTKLSDDGREKILEFLEEGAFVGEMALLERAPRSASVKTLTPVRLLALSRTDFIGLLKKSPDLAMAVIQMKTMVVLPAIECITVHECNPKQ